MSTGLRYYHIIYFQTLSEGQKNPSRAAEHIMRGKYNNHQGAGGSLTVGNCLPANNLLGSKEMRMARTEQKRLQKKFNYFTSQKLYFK
jgi:hypothetical protein